MTTKLIRNIASIIYNRVSERAELPTNYILMTTENPFDPETPLNRPLRILGKKQIDGSEFFIVGCEAEKGSSRGHTFLVRRELFPLSYRRFVTLDHNTTQQLAMIENIAAEIHQEMIEYDMEPDTYGRGLDEDSDDESSEEESFSWDKTETWIEVKRNESPAIMGESEMREAMFQRSKVSWQETRDTLTEIKKV